MSVASDLLDAALILIVLFCIDHPIWATLVAIWLMCALSYRRTR